MRYVSIGTMFCLAVGAGLIAYSANFVRDRIEFSRNALSADGVITDSYDENDGGRNTTSQVPVVTFTTKTGEVIHTSGESFSSLTNWSLGNHVRVLYSEADPDRAQIDTFAENWMPVLLIGGIGLLFALFGVGPIVVEIYRWLLHRRLEYRGTLVKAQFVGSEQHRFSGTIYWQIQCRWQQPTTDVTYNFVSDPLEFDPTSFAQNNTLDVRVDIDHPKRYEVDVEPIVLAHSAAAESIQKATRKFDIRANIWTGLPFVIAAIAFFILAFSFWRAGETFSSSASRADGTVVRVVHDRSTFDPIVEFATADGQLVQFRGAGAKPAPYAKGDHVTVLFDGAHPADARISSFREQRGAPVAFAVFGIILLVIGVTELGRKKKIPKESTEPVRQVSQADAAAVARSIERHQRRIANLNADTVKQHDT